ncbi:28S ribosomal protein S10, mitochondrial-like [Gigantopelta aegis]|uniref:28S ribosomal protein S10, mitochondrial-like n=1 Tax=Gigantopelta aegis TaxID=1735272 RepID=UPI001B88DD53|nr:28S ribosomal protein S10, mitochondrial-like [Gigantopelta aegis]
MFVNKIPGHCAACLSRLSKIYTNRSVCLSQHISKAKVYATNTEHVSAADEGEPDDLFRQITIEVKTHDPAVLNSYEKFTKMAADELNITVGKIFRPPKVFWRDTLLKSVHVFKKHRVQYEARTHFSTIELKHLTGSTADTYLEYIQRNLPEGMAMKVTKHRLEALPDNLKNIKVNTPEDQLEKS